MSQGLHAAPRRIAVVGTGRFARALVRALPARVRWVIGRSSEEAAEVAALADSAEVRSMIGGVDVDLIWIATSDHAIPIVAEEIAAQRPSWASVAMMHSSGATSIQALGPFSARKGRVFALHPNVSLTGSEPIPRGLYWGATTEERTDRDLAAALLEELEPRLVWIDDRYRRLYHAAASAAANYTVALHALATELYRSAGVEAEIAERIVSEFMLQSVRSVSARGAAATITGPVVRRDDEVVVAQIDAVSLAKPEVADAFSEMALLTARLFAPENAEVLRGKIAALNAESDRPSNRA